MPKLKLGPIADEKPVKIIAELPAATYRDLTAYAEALGRETGQTVEPAQLIAPMIVRFMISDRGFTKSRRGRSAVALIGDSSSARAPGSESA